MVALANLEAVLPAAGDVWRLWGGSIAGFSEKVVGWWSGCGAIASCRIIERELY